MKKKEQLSNLRILFLGSTEGDSTSVYYFSNLLKLGCPVYPFDPDPMRPRNIFQKAYLKWNHQPAPTLVKQNAEKIISIVKNNQFDLIFVMSQNYISAETLREIRKVSKIPPTIIYHSHDNNFYPGVLTPSDFHSAITEFDHVFTTKSQNVDKYQQLGQPNSHFIPSAFEPTVHMPISESRSRFGKTMIDVSFVGTYDRSRDALINAVGWHQLKVWGSHWKKFSEYSVHSNQIHNGAVYYFEYADILSHSRISLGLLREEAEDRHTQRTFEIPACGSLQLAPRKPELLSFFEEDKEIVCFDSPEELREKVEFYLKHPKTRDAIAKRGYQRVLEDGHTYGDRVATILKTSMGLRQRSLKKVG